MIILTAVTTQNAGYAALLSMSKFLAPEALHAVTYLMQIWISKVGTKNVRKEYAVGLEFCPFCKGVSRP
jgi:hypothetical protein